MDPNEPAIVDCDLLEAAKENIQPLASGRRVTSLSTVLNTPHALRESKLSEERAKWRAAVQRSLDSSSTEVDDENGEHSVRLSPLEAYQMGVTWTLENYPQGHSAESGLLELLEEATRVLKDQDNGAYRGELKYLKLWVLYANFVEKPVTVYRFLLANDLGTGWGLFYEEFALALERAGKHKEADAIYQLGMARKATSMDKLRSRYGEFQKRMMSGTTLPPRSETAPSVTPPAAPKRTVLGTTSATTPITTQAPTTSRSSGNSSIQIFQDTGPPSEEVQTNPYPDLGTRKTRIKENVKEAGKMSGTIMKSRSAVSHRPAPGGSSIVIYQDPPEGDADPNDNARPRQDEKLKAPANKGKAPSVSVDAGRKPSLLTNGKAKTSGPSGKSALKDAPKPSSSKPPGTSGADAARSKREPEVSKVSQPGFVPFQDEVTTTQSTGGFVPYSEQDRTKTVVGGKEKEKGKEVMGRVHSLSEALRKDPLKNHLGADELSEDLNFGLGDLRL